MFQWCRTWRLSVSDVDSDAFKQISLANLHARQQQATLLHTLQLSF
jgi:hypothetical protein